MMKMTSSPCPGWAAVTEAFTFRDYPVIQGINLLVAFWIILINLSVDISYGFLDPRVRYR